MVVQTYFISNSLLHKGVCTCLYYIRYKYYIWAQLCRLFPKSLRYTRNKQNRAACFANIFMLGEHYVPGVCLYLLVERLFQEVRFKVHDPKAHSKGGTLENTINGGRGGTGDEENPPAPPAHLIHPGKVPIHTETLNYPLPPRFTRPTPITVMPYPYLIHPGKVSIHSETLNYPSPPRVH